MVVYTRAAGRTSIRVKVQCLNASAGQFEGNVTELTDEIQVLVCATGWAHCRGNVWSGRHLWAACMSKCSRKASFGARVLGIAATLLLHSFTPSVYVCFCGDQELLFLHS